MELVKGQKYDIHALRFLGWTQGDGSSAEGYAFVDYFETDGTYVGPDQHGIEPMVELSPLEIEGAVIEVDASGAGQGWRAADEDSCPAHIQQEIAAEIIDGEREECAQYVASNGLHYRWS